MESWAAILAGLLCAPLSGPPGRLDEEKKTEAADNRGLQGAVAALRAGHPDAYRAARGARVVSERLLQAVKGSPGTEEERTARVLAAEALEAAGEEAGAQRLRDLVRVEGPDPASRAHAAFALGMSQLLRERYDGAERYFRLVPEIDPSSPWAARAGRLKPYFEVLRTRAVPPFSGSFGPPLGPVRKIASSDLAGRYLLLHFWSSSSPGEKDRVKELDRIRSRLGARVKEGVELLGVNLDAAPEAFQRAARDWGMSWPQHHDGLGFAGPLAGALAIPRLPHFLAIAPDGRAVYLGGDMARMEKALLAPATKKAPKK